MVKEQDLRVKLSSKDIVVGQIEKCKELLTRSLDAQTRIPKESKQLLLQELLTNFETAVQDNVLIDGQPWEDAPHDGENERGSLDNLLDESIVETVRRRREYTQAIVPYVVSTLKAERKLMGMFEQAVPQELKKDPVQEHIMSDLSASAQRTFKQASLMMKSSDDDGRRMMRREKNRVAAQKSRKRQTQRADILHEAYTCMEQRNQQLRREVTSLLEEQRYLLELLQTHEPCCPMMHCSTNPGTGPRDVPERPLS